MEFLPHLVVIILVIIPSAKCELSTFGYCIKTKPYLGVVSCLGEQALHTLQTIEETDNYTIINGLSMVRDSGFSMPRSIPFNFLDRDSLNLRALLDQTGVILSQRSLQWDLGSFYPGLMMKVGPAGDANSVLEFVMDNVNHQELDDRAGEPSTARLLTKSLLLPFLLGFKFNLAVLLPVILGILILIGKKAVFLSKLALLLTGVFGAGGVASLFGLATKPISGIGLGSFNTYHHGHDYYKDYRDFKDYKVSHRHYESTTKPYEPDHFYDFENKFFTKRGGMSGTHIFERESNDFKMDTSTESPSAASEFVSRNDYKNFAWHTIKQ